MTNKNSLELHGTLKLSTWLSNLLRAELGIVPLGDSYYASVHAGLYQGTRIILLFTLAYTKRLVLSFCSCWLIPRDSYYPVHAGSYQETRIILLFTLAYTKRRNCHMVDGKVQGVCHHCLTPNIPSVIGSFHACPVTWSTSRIFVLHKRDISCFITKVRLKNAVCAESITTEGQTRHTNQLTVCLIG